MTEHDKEWAAYQAWKKDFTGPIYFHNWDQWIREFGFACWQASRRAALEEARAVQPVEQTRALTDEQRLIEAIRGWSAKQKPLDAVAQKILYDNLWDLYVDDTAARPASGETE